MTDFSQILIASAAGDPQAASHLLPLVYAELAAGSLLRNWPRKSRGRRFDPPLSCMKPI